MCNDPDCGTVYRCSDDCDEYLTDLDNELEIDEGVSDGDGDDILIECEKCETAWIIKHDCDNVDGDSVICFRDIFDAKVTSEEESIGEEDSYATESLDSAKFSFGSTCTDDDEFVVYGTSMCTCGGRPPYCQKCFIDDHMTTCWGEKDDDDYYRVGEKRDRDDELEFGSLINKALIKEDGNGCLSVEYIGPVSSRTRSSIRQMNHVLASLECTESL